MPSEPSTKRAIAFFDGQNLFHAVRAAFGHRYPNYEPRKLANAICRVQGWHLVETRFYTGVPDATDGPFWNHFWTAKLAQMGRAGIHTYAYFVPNNDSDTVSDRQDRLTSKVARPHRLVGGDTVHYVWSIEPSEDGRAQLLCEEANHLLALGWGVDQVVGRGRLLSAAELDELPGRRWRAWGIHRTGTQAWRVPAEGFVGDLEEAHGSFIERVDGGSYRPPRKPTCFESVHYLSSTALPARAYAVFELPDGVGFRAERAAVVAAMARSLTCRAAEGDTHKFPGGEVYVAGHVAADERTPPRFTYLPLPTIGHEHSDGVIRRLLIAEPFGGDGTHCSWAQQRLRNATLLDEHGEERGVLLDLWRPQSRRIVGRYVRESQEWYSVTPVVLPGLDDGKQSKAERLLLKAAAHAEVPIEAIQSVALRKAPFWSGGEHPRHYFVPNYLRPFARWHAAVRFREPVPGPLAIGAGRHVGLGLFASADDAAQQQHAAADASRRR